MSFRISRRKCGSVQDRGISIMEYSNPYENKNLKPPFVNYYDIFETFAKEVGAELEISLRLLPPIQLILRENEDCFFRSVYAYAIIHEPNYLLAKDCDSFGFSISIDKYEDKYVYGYSQNIFKIEKMPENKETVREMLQTCWDELCRIDTSNYHNWERIQIYGEAYKALQRERIKGKKPKLATDTLYKALQREQVEKEKKKWGVV